MHFISALGLDSQPLPPPIHPSLWPSLSVLAFTTFLLSTFDSQYFPPLFSLSSFLFLSGCTGSLYSSFSPHFYLFLISSFLCPLYFSLLSNSFPTPPPPPLLSRDYGWRLPAGKLRSSHRQAGRQGKESKGSQIDE